MRKNLATPFSVGEKSYILEHFETYNNIYAVQNVGI